MFANIVQQRPARIAFQVCRHTLLVTWSIDFVCCLSVQPNAAAALIGITLAAERGMVQLVEWSVLDVQTAFQITCAESFLTLFSDGFLTAIFLLCVIESGADIKLAIRS